MIINLAYSNMLPTIFGLIVSLFGVKYIGRIFNSFNFFGDTYSGQLIFSDIKKWILVLIIFIIILFWENRAFISIGFRETSYKSIIQAAILGVISVILAMFILGIVYNVLGLEEPDTLSNIASVPIMIKLMTITTAAVTEEILYRGYSIERINELSGSLLLAGIISGFIFLAIHYSDWGIAGAIPQVIFTIFLVSFYIKTRDLKACIVMHWVINFLMIIVLPSLMAG